MNYVYEIPTPFIETNIRTVYLNHFFTGEKSVSDRELQKIVERTMDRENPREWYWALMDYGVWLKGQGAGALTLSQHYRKQSPLKGSVREVRGQIIAQLTKHDYSLDQLSRKVEADERFAQALEGLLQDGLIEQTGEQIHLTKH
jgi:A/G-specific adenine glycosylase